MVNQYSEKTLFCSSQTGAYCLTMLLNIINEIGFVLVAIICGLLVYKHADGFNRVLFIHLLSYSLLYALGYLVTEYQQSRGEPLNNHWVFNLNILTETSLLTLAAFKYFEKGIKRRIVAGTFFAFIVIYAIQILQKGIFVFSVLSFIVESLAMTAVYSLVLYDCLKERKISTWRNPVFWAVLGMLIYFACNLPYFSLFNYLNENHIKLSKLLIHVTETLANVRYICVAIGFLVLYKNRPLPDSK